jgi:Predicted hydrolases or acyltransferases (alpha/beta hydrolase superfamily)
MIKPEERREKMFISQAEQDAIKNIEKKASEGKFTTDAQVIYNKRLCGDWKRFSYCKPTIEELARKAFYEWGPAKGFEELMRPESDKISLKGKFDDFEIPTLIMEAKWDLLWWNPDRAEVMRKNHPHAQVKIFKKSGHMIFFDEPEKFFPLLKDFLEKSSKMQIVYKPGNRLVWPKPLSE